MPPRSTLGAIETFMRVGQGLTPVQGRTVGTRRDRMLDHVLFRQYLARQLRTLRGCALQGLLLWP